MLSFLDIIMNFKPNYFSFADQHNTTGLFCLNFIYDMNIFVVFVNFCSGLYLFIDCIYFTV